MNEAKQTGKRTRTCLNMKAEERRKVFMKTLATELATPHVKHRVSQGSANAVTLLSMEMAGFTVRTIGNRSSFPIADRSEIGQGR